MNHSTSKILLSVLAFSAALASPQQEVQADVRRGILYDILHFGKGCDPFWDFSPCRGVEGWLDAELAAEKARIREEVRIHHMHLYLHNQDHKKLLHPECSPFQDCYWGVYPTCWRQFPGRQYCPPSARSSLICEPGPYGDHPYEPGPPMNPDLFGPGLNERDGDFESPELAPLSPETPASEPEAPLYFE